MGSDSTNTAGQQAPAAAKQSPASTGPLSSRSPIKGAIAGYLRAHAKRKNLLQRAAAGLGGAAAGYAGREMERAGHVRDAWKDVKTLGGSGSGSSGASSPVRTAGQQPPKESTGFEHRGANTVKSQE